MEVLRPTQETLSQAGEVALNGLKFVANQLRGGAWADLADQVMEDREPQMAAIHYFPRRSPEPEFPDAA